jgi:phenylalanyl-tRNA synthetase beta chain
MPVVVFDYIDFIDLLKYEISKDALIEKLPMIGADFDSVDGDEISIEFFPDRPDLASVEGIVRASRTFFGFETGLKQFPVEQSDIVITVDPSVKQVRPFVTTALVKNVTMTDELIASLMELQEKLHFGLGRNRKKIAIGVHNFEPVQPPFVYKAVAPDSVSFVPLAKTESMTLTEILQRHEKGVAYRFLLEQFDRYPLIVDANDNVLSFPPIINGSLTEVTPFTTDLFIDVTGTDLKYINYAMNIVVTALAERGGKIFSTTVKDGKTSYTSPDLTPTKKKLSVSYVHKLLGAKLTEEEIIECLQRMGYNAQIMKKDTITVEIPAWRTDILHEIDIVEDVAIGYGFDRFTTDFPRQVTFGETLPRHDFYTGLRSVMIGLGFNEVTTFTISNEHDEFIRLGLKIDKRVEIANPIGEDYSCLRLSLLPSLLKILRENRHHPLPQNVFELGVVVDATARNRNHLAAVKIDAKANFTECKSLIEAVLRGTGITYTVKNKTHPAFISGRCAAVLANGNEIGVFGELHPQTITQFELAHPIIAFELRADLIKSS